MIDLSVETLVSVTIMYYGIIESAIACEETNERLCATRNKEKLNTVLILLICPNGGKGRQRKDFVLCYVGIPVYKLTPKLYITWYNIMCQRSSLKY